MKGYEGEEIFDVDFNDDGDMVSSPFFLLPSGVGLMESETSLSW